MDTQHLSLLEMRISSPLLPVILVLQEFLSDWPPEHLAGLLELHRRWTTGDGCSLLRCPTHRQGQRQPCSREPPVSPARQINKHPLWCVPDTPLRLEGPHSRADLEIKYKFPGTVIPAEQPSYYHFQAGKKKEE